MTAHPELLAALAANHALLRELGLRYSVATDHTTTSGAASVVVQTPEDIALLNEDMLLLVQEQMRVVLMTVKQTVIDVVTVYQGTVDTASVRVAEVLRPAILANAPKIVLVHNHPSGDAEPSGADLQATRRIVAAAQLMDVLVQDHVIVARGGAPVSFKRRGLGGIE